MMKAVVGIFDPADAKPVREGLLASGVRPEDVVEMTTVEAIPAYLEGEPERKASRGWLGGTILGALIGAAAGWLALDVFNIQTSTIIEILIVLVSAGAGAAIGGYLASIYSVRAGTELDMNIHEALSEGKTLLMVQTSGNAADATAGVMRRYNFDQVKVYPIPEERELV